MNNLSISLALLSLAGLPQEQVVYIPGWHRCTRGEDEALRFVAAAFPEAGVSAWDWDGNCAWRMAMVGWFRSLAAHYAPFYLEHVKQLSGERRKQ